MTTTLRPWCILSIIAIAAAAALAAAVPADPPATPDDTKQLMADLQANVGLHRAMTDRLDALHRAGRIPEIEVIPARIATLEAEILVLTVAEDPGAVVALREGILHSLPADAPDVDRTGASQDVAAARVRLWRATRPQH